MPANLPVPPAVLEQLLSLAQASLRRDQGAQQQLRMLGELVEWAGGVQKLCDLQGAVHDLRLDRRIAQDLAGEVGNWWEHIPAWAAL